MTLAESENHVSESVNDLNISLSDLEMLNQESKKREFAIKAFHRLVAPEHSDNSFSHLDEDDEDENLGLQLEAELAAYNLQAPEELVQQFEDEDNGACELEENLETASFLTVADEFYADLLS